MGVRKSLVADGLLANDEDVAEVAINMLAEASLQVQFRHPNVLPLIGAVTLRSPVLVMPFCANGSLEGLLRKQDPHFFPWFIFFANDVCRGLEYLARYKFVHRDVAARC